MTDAGSLTSPSGAIGTSGSAMIFECAICTDSHAAGDMVRMGCAHYHCTRCLMAAFKLAMRSSPFVPARCCDVIPTLILRKLVLPSTGGINISEIQLYREKMAEYAVPLDLKLYCWKTGCGAFIPAILRDKRGGTCRKCRARTCGTCGGQRHSGLCQVLKKKPQPTVDDSEDRLRRIARRLGWKVCPQCKNMVEKTMGCNHIR